MESVVKKEENKILKKIVKLFCVFVIGSIIGYLLEMIVGLVQNGHFVSKQGLIYGPFSQVYGIGLVIYYLLIPNNKKNIEIFLISMFLGGIVEYMNKFIALYILGNWWNIILKIHKTTNRKNRFVISKNVV